MPVIASAGTSRDSSFCPSVLPIGTPTTEGSGGDEQHEEPGGAPPSDARSDGPADDNVDTDLLILKARGGPTSEVKLRFERRFTRFVEAETKHANDFPLDASGGRGGARS